MARFLLTVPIRRLVAPLVARKPFRRPHRRRSGAVRPRPSAGAAGVPAASPQESSIPDLVEGQELREYVAHQEALE